MEKRKIISIILSINSIIFFCVNAETESMNITLGQTFWGWSIWLYLLICLITSLNDIVLYRYSLTQYIIIVLNFISQFCICGLFVYSYCHQVLGLDACQKKLFAGIIVGVEFCSRMTMEPGKDRYCNVAEEAITKVDIREYVQTKILRCKSHLKRSTEQRIQIVLENVITLILLPGTSFILRMVMDITFENEMIFTIAKKYVLCLFIFFMILFVIFNYRKYTCASYHKIKFAVDSALGIVAMIIWVFDRSHSVNFGKILFVGYLLIPFLFAFYDIINVYQLGKGVTSRKEKI